ncbi:hypothetical protein AWH56_005900 [Anaerobacillus isosaccharinicus]|uniref:Uncharacterized protein n=1 Tax=Anaerobacillus isosaccharinicus TaxID=1532552 RepID=A0A1S2LUK9_9BACI|nr:hypothetical protein [Anaerobacillus isosaccharinicus]MBA5584442.1 hypothetical protein [Anaerobacillus isosaccharinicus]QOY37170.1 hypothetical protein AWH56_005900 [Anaerobacillus isosaccharinicus]
MKPIKVDNIDLKKIIQSGNSYIQVGHQKFLLMEVENAKEADCYEVTDPEEEKQLLKALNEQNPILSEDEINRILGL